MERRSIVGYPGYAVSRDGVVWTNKKMIKGRPEHQMWVHGEEWRKLSPGLADGYLAVSLCVNGRTKTFKVALLVLEAFVGPRPLGMECCHNDGNPRNARLDNLRWDTHANNVADQLRHGTRNRGERNGKAILTESQVREIRKRCEAGESRPVVAKDFKVARTTVQSIVERKSWRHVS